MDAVHFDHNHEGLFGRVSRNVGAALDWLTGPGMTDQKRAAQTLTDVRNQRFDDTVI